MPMKTKTQKLIAAEISCFTVYNNREMQHFQDLPADKKPDAGLDVISWRPFESAQGGENTERHMLILLILFYCSFNKGRNGMIV